MQQGEKVAQVCQFRDNDNTFCYISYILFSGFQLLKDVLGQSAFYSSGYPKCVITDDSDAERGALAEVWPQSKLLLCIFHVLQAAWRWLWNSKNAIAKSDRKSLISVLKSLVYAGCEDTFNTSWNASKGSQLSQKYENCTK